MLELPEILIKNSQNLAPTTQKQVKKFLQKILNTAYYPDRKKLAKMSEIISDELNDFLLSAVREYYAIHHDPHSPHTEHFDICELRGVWTAMSFSRSPEILAFLQSEIDGSLKNSGFKHRYLFEIFRLHNEPHPLLDVLYTHYDALVASHKIYKLLDHIGVSPADKYDFCAIFTLTNVGAFYSDSFDKSLDLTRKFRLEIWLKAPFINEKSFLLSVRNSDIPCARVDFDDNGLHFCQKTDESAFAKVDLLDLKPLIKSIESHFDIKFNSENVKNQDMFCLTASKGLNRAKLTAWFASLFD